MQWRKKKQGETYNLPIKFLTLHVIVKPMEFKQLPNRLYYLFSSFSN